MEPKTPDIRHRGMVHYPTQTPARQNTGAPQSVRERNAVQWMPSRQNPARASAINASPLAILATLVVSGVLALAILFAAAASYYLYFQATGRIVPGAHVGQTHIGGMTVTEAAIELQKVWNLESRILVTNGIQSFELAPADLGLSIDPLRTAQMAHQTGHGGLILEEFVQLYQGVLEDWKVVPITQLDPEVARAQLQSLQPLMSLSAKDATILVVGDQLSAAPGEIGYTINMEETLDNLAKDPGAVLAGGALQVIVKPVLPEVMDAGAALAEAQQLLDTPITIQAYDPIMDKYFTWQAPRQVVASWLVVKAEKDGPQVSFSPDGIAAYLETINQEFGDERYLEKQDNSFHLATNLPQGNSPLLFVKRAPTTYVVQPNDTLLKIGWKLRMPYWMILEANPGLDPDSLWVGAQLVVPSKDKLLPLPIIPDKRIILSIGKQHMWIYKDGSVIRDFVISTGIDRSPTQPGVFQVQTHDPNAYASVWDLYMPNFMGIYESWPGFMNGIHGLPTLSNGRRLWANILGSPASYGCIILDLPPSEWLYNWAENGVVVEIQP